MKELNVKKICDLFDLTIVNESFCDLSKTIASPAIQRKGLRLAGIKIPSDLNNQIVGWGTKERKYLESLGKAKAIKAIENVIDQRTPLIVLSMGFNKKAMSWVVEVANKHNTPVIYMDMHSSVLHPIISSYLIEFFAETVDLHASLVIIDGFGVMLKGKSGIGKSEAVLDLINSGRIFVSDDTVILKRIGRKFYGSSNHLTKGFLESRGIGIIDIPKVYGLRSYKEKTQVDLVIELLDMKEHDDFDRLGNKNLEFKALGHFLPLIEIPVNKGQNVASLIEAAVNVFAANKKGHDPLSIIANRRDKDV